MSGKPMRNPKPLKESTNLGRMETSIHSETDIWRLISFGGLGLTIEIHGDSQLAPRHWVDR